MSSNETQKRQRTEQGQVVHAGNKTIAIRVERLVKHPMYGKYIRRSAKYQAHDEKNECNVGDIVEIAESRPISKTKSWVLTKIVERAA